MAKGKLVSFVPRRLVNLTWYFSGILYQEKQRAAFPHPLFLRHISIFVHVDPVPLQTWLQGIPSESRAKCWLLQVHQLRLNHFLWEEKKILRWYLLTAALPLLHRDSHCWSLAAILLCHHDRVHYHNHNYKNYSSCVFRAVSKCLVLYASKTWLSNL